jgi:mRNA interferase HigB
MKVHLIKEKTIYLFSINHTNCYFPLEDWVDKIRNAGWEKPEDILFTFPSCDLLGNGSSRVIFNIKGNQFRLIGKYGFGENQVHLFICWIGSHADYSKLCAKGLQYTISTY